MARLRSFFIIFCPGLLPSPIRKQLRCGVVIHMQVRMKLERAWSIGMVGEGLTAQKSLGLDRGWGKGAGQLVGPVFPYPTLQTKTVPCSHLQVLAYVVPPTWKPQQGCPEVVCFQALPLPQTVSSRTNTCASVSLFVKWGPTTLLLQGGSSHMAD